MISLPGGEPYALPLLHMGDGRVPGRLLDRFRTARIVSRSCSGARPASVFELVAPCPMNSQPRFFISSMAFGKTSQTCEFGPASPRGFFFRVTWNHLRCTAISHGRHP